jgi:hypothetical protein
MNEKAFASQHVKGRFQSFGKDPDNGLGYFPIMLNAHLNVIY